MSAICLYRCSGQRYSPSLWALHQQRCVLWALVLSVSELPMRGFALRLDQASSRFRECEDLRRFAVFRLFGCPRGLRPMSEVRRSFDEHLRVVAPVVAAEDHGHD